MPVMKYRAQDGTVYPIAHGPKGDKGDPGPQGPQGDPGEVTQAELDAVESAKVDRAGDTMSGTLLFPDGGQSIRIDNYGSVDLRGTTGERSTLSTAGGVAARWRNVNHPGGPYNIFQVLQNTGQLMLTENPGGVYVPIPTNGQQVPRLARTPNPTTGDLGLPGYAGSDTGWRDISADLESGFTGTARLRRSGWHVNLAVNVDGSASSGINCIQVPVGFQPSQPLNLAGAGNNDTWWDMSWSTRRLRIRAGNTGAIIWANASYLTDLDWPSSLPGTEVTPPASWT